MKQEYDNLCRICGHYNMQLMPIFSGDGLEHNLATKIKKHFYSIKVEEDDILPLQMCYQCISVLISWNNLFELSEEIDQKFQKELGHKTNNSTLPKNAPPKKKSNSHRTGSSTTVNNSSSDNTGSSCIIISIPEEHRYSVCQSNGLSSVQNSNLADDVSTDKVADTAVSSESKDAQNNVSDQDDAFEDGAPWWNDMEPNFEAKKKQQDSVSKHVEKKNLEGAPNNAPGEIGEIAANGLSTPVVKRKRSRYKYDEDPSKRTCEMCSKSFSCPVTLKLHMKTVHSVIRPYICKSCPAAFKRRDHLTVHVKSVHENVKITRAPRYGRSQQLLCVHCGKILSTKHSLSEHINSLHTKNRVYKCDKCDATFNRRSSYYTHRTKTNHDHKPFLKSCEHCGLEFENKIYYIRHKWKHSENVTCDLCSITFETADLFRQHVDKTHYEEKSLQCETCGKEFSRKNSFLSHLRTHSQEKKYHCMYCEWKFLKKGHLVNHMYRHTGERPYACNICGRAFKQKGDMRKHKAGHLKSTVKMESS